MQKRKLIIANDLHPQLVENIKQHIPQWEIYVGKDAAIWNEHLAEAEVIAGWTSELTHAVKKEKMNLRWIQSWSAGINGFPLETLAEKNILLTSANGVHAYPISETIFAFMLGLTRKIPGYIRNQEEKKWHHAGLRLEMHEKTVGIIGVGAIGKETAKIAKAFNMHVLGVRRSGKPEEYVDEMFTLSDLPEVLPRCDYVIVTLPLTVETKGLFTLEMFTHMKSSAFFINIGRGDIVVESALIQALQEGTIAGAGLDVFEVEPLPPSSPLWEMENVILTPHTSGGTEQYNRRLIEEIFIPNLLDYVNKKPLSVNLIDYEIGY